jgi:hypothetical protein
MPKAWLTKDQITRDGKDSSEAKAESCEYLGKDGSIVYIDGLAFKMWGKIHTKSKKSINICIWRNSFLWSEGSTTPSLKAIPSIHRKTLGMGSS